MTLTPWINGESVQLDGRPTAVIPAPYTGKPAVTLAVGTEKDLERAIGAAQSGFATMRAMPATPAGISWRASPISCSGNASRWPGSWR